MEMLIPVLVIVVPLLFISYKIYHSREYSDGKTYVTEKDFKTIMKGVGYRVCLYDYNIDPTIYFDDYDNYPVKSKDLGPIKDSIKKVGNNLDEIDHSLKLLLNHLGLRIEEGKRIVKNK